MLRIFRKKQFSKIDEERKGNVLEIKEIISQNITVYLGGNIAQIFIHENNVVHENLNGDFLIVISDQAKESSLSHYVQLLRECIKQYKENEEFYTDKGNLCLEDMLRYCIVKNNIKIACFFKLNNCIHILPNP